MIPKIIHYCWFGPKPLPKVVKRCIASWHKHMPDWEYRLWNENNSPMEHPFVKAAYEAKKYAFVADYVRFWALYNYGGVYLDTDMLVVKPFDDLLDADFFGAWETAIPDETIAKVVSRDKGDAERSEVSPIISCGALGACALGACALGAQVKKILEKYDELIFDPANLAPFVVPRLITPVLLQDIQSEAERIHIYPYDYFYPLPYNERFALNKLKYNTKNTYAVHLWDISWGKRTAKLKDKIFYIVRSILKH